jgi:hypothetical protein
MVGSGPELWNLLKGEIKTPLRTGFSYYFKVREKIQISQIFFEKSKEKNREWKKI